MKNLFVFLFCITIIPFFSFANIINVPADQPTIQAGINAAVNGDTVLVADNIYYENINFKGKAIFVASHFLIDGDTTHIGSTIINGSQPSHPDSGSVVYFISGEDTNSVLCGFTITGGSGTDFISGSSLRTAGGGIFSYYSGPKICNNRIENNNVYHASRYTHGGGIYTGPIGSNTYIIIEDNKIQSNVVESVNGNAYGGGIRISSNGRVVRNKIINNEANCSASRSGGGGIYCFNENIKPFKFVTIKENIITNNQSFSNSSYAKSGGVGLSYTDCFIDSNTISNNISNGATGGNATGIHIYYADSVTIVQNNQIISNTGGGMQVEFSDGITVIDNRIENNESNSSVSGGITEYQCTNTKIIQNEIIGNIASNNGAGVNFMQCINTQIYKNEFIGNIAGNYGGGIYNFGCVNTTISENKLNNNSANSAGGGIAVINSHAKIIRNLISDNTATSCGGGLAIGSSSEKLELNLSDETVHSMGGLDFGNVQINPEHNNFHMHKKTETDSQTVLVNNTITDNYAAIGGGIYNEFESTLIINTILYGDSAISDTEIYNDGGTVQIQYSDIQGGYPGIGNIDNDPLFADTLLYHLGIGSPCIDSGDPATACNDSDGTRNDMGRYGGVTDSLYHHITGLFEIPNTDLIPKEFTLSQNYPNPFNPITNIEFQTVNNGFVTLKIFDILGREVATLVSEKLNRGKYKYVWDASGFASGVYFYKLITNNGFSKEKKLILLR